MSGGKKKMMRTQGWEEAGSEFYQESYPTDADIDAIQRDPRHLATLLPSKQNRAATTLRFRTNDTRTFTQRRQTSQRKPHWETLGTRGTATTAGGDMMSMMVDLSADLPNEQTMWEKIMEIKILPVPMAHKREMKAKILNTDSLRLQGYEQLNWKRRKLFHSFTTTVTETLAKLTLFQGALKRIEGHFGTGVVAYFLFVKYLLFLNLFMFALIFTFITLPTIIVNEESACNASNETNYALDFLQGTGFMECTLLFYGYYPREIFRLNDNLFYNLPLAYLCIYFVGFALPLVFIVRSGAHGLKERIVEGEGQFYQYCNLVFGGWDYCIQNGKSARIKHRALFNDIRECLETERRAESRQNRTRNDKIKLYAIRAIVNVVVLAVLVAAGFLIYFVFNYCTKQTEQQQQHWMLLLFQFLPSITIVCLNILVPVIFRHLIALEHYSPLLVIRIMLARTVVLRLASIFTLCASLNAEIATTYREEGACWETFVGQQIYKLALTDFATNVLITFFLNWPRALLARKFTGSKFAQLIGAQSFDLPKHVLDVVYSQTLAWLGCFYAPLLSFMFALIFFLMFQIKRFACLSNSSPSGTIYRASRSESMFMIVLLVAFVSAIVPLGFAISDLVPSRECGPFRGLESVWSEVAGFVDKAPYWVRDGVTFVATAGFAIPMFILLLLAFYYYRAVNSANRHMVIVLKNQLVMEGHDKQFLLERLSKLQIGDNTISMTN